MHVHNPLHSVIALTTGVVSVNVPTAIDGLFSATTAAELALFTVKGIIGGLLSVGITRGVDYWKNRNKQQQESNNDATR